MANDNPPEEEWYVLRSGSPTSPSILSVRPSLPSEAIRSRFQVEVTLRWVYTPNETGLPASETDIKAMYAFEEALRARDTLEIVFLQAIRKTGNGARTWVYFSSSEQAFRDLLGQDARVTLSFAPDPNWSELSKILKGIRH
jgi:Family of unknown function (DUF695)